VSAPGESGIVVPCVDLDTLVLEGRVAPPQLLKIDVEGHDAEILRGSATVLAKYGPTVCLEGGLRARDGHIPSLQLLIEAGYALWDLGLVRPLQPDTDEYVVVAMPARVS
jgi:hypothetical protein